jgi:hypothetical protein
MSVRHDHQFLVSRGIVGCVLALATLSIAAAKPNFQTVNISLPRFALARGERVVTVHCKVKGGFISKIKAPPGWSVTIDNGHGIGESDGDGNIILGTAALTQEELGFFQNFVEIRKPKEADKYNPPFDVTVELSISSDQDMTIFRSLKFSKKQLRLSLRSGTNDYVS